MRTSAFITILATLAVATSTFTSAAPIPEQLEERGMTSPRITFYSGSQLNNPACGGPTPSRNSMIAAVKQGGAFSCGDHIRISHKNKSIKVKVVDYCESCSDKAVDLTPGAFAKLASLDEGIIRGAKMSLD
jgi:expansin (peptidoglycan-binding protein)